MSIVADYSAGFPGAKELREAGFIGAVRYIGLDDPKCTNAAELNDFTQHGLGMALVFERFADDWRGGWQRGYNNYRIARAHANAIGFPADRPIYMAVDSEVIGPSAHKMMQDYLTGARDAALGDYRLVGVYGQYSVCQWLHDIGGIVDWYWQCRAWSGTPVKYFDDRHLFQRVGTVTVNRIPSDINDVSQDDWGQHNGGTMDWDTFKSFMERYERFHGRFGGPEADGANGPSRRETFQQLLEHAQKGTPVTMSEEDRNAIIAGLAPAVADLLAERLKD